MSLLRFPGVLLLLLLVTASMITISVAIRSKVTSKPKCEQRHSNSSSGSGSSWSYSSCGNGSQPPTQSPKKLSVGGKYKWSERVNFEQWASTNQPFQENDILVFQYDRKYSVSLMMDMQHMFQCDFSQAKLIGNSTAGAGHGFEFVLKPKTSPGWSDPSYYFACQGYCQKGMRFSAYVLPKYW